MNKMKRFISYYKPHLPIFALDMTCAVLVCAIDLGFPMLTNYLLKTLFPAMQTDESLLRVFLLIMGAALLFYILKAVFNYIITYWGHMLGIRMEASMRRDLFTHLQTLPFSFYDKIRTGKLMSRLTTDLFEIGELAHHGPEDLIISSVTIIGAFICMAVLEWRLALALLFVLIPMAVFVMKSRISMRKTSYKVKEKTAEINAGIESAISGVRVAKAFANEDHEIVKFDEGNDHFVHAKDSWYKAMALFHSGTVFFTGCFTLVVLAAGGYLVYRGILQAADLLTFSLFVSAFTSPVNKLAALADTYMVGAAGFSRFCEIMELQSDITDLPGAEDADNVQGDIAFRDVVFAYEEGRDILNGVNITIPAGKTVAFVGPSGGGKTTLCHLIPRFYEPRSGSVTIDGRDVRALTLRSLRRNVGIVQQDVFLFADTVMENIRYGRLDATDEEVMEAARRAHIHEEIESFTNGYHTMVGERGITLSGGQKQRISIARLFLKNPPVLILDEATSALDSVTEADIQHSFEELSKGRTTLVIAHRLSTVKHADEIIVIDDHGVRERGTHEELLAADGLYANLYRITLEA